MRALETDGRVRLRDGRNLAYAEYGTPDGEPVLFFHGTPGSRFGGRLLAAAATRLDVRIVAPDRPGQGRSTYLSHRTISEWADDVRELTDQLGIDEFAVVGFSGGSPYVAACAQAIPDRVSNAAIVSGVAPPAAPMDGTHPSNRVKTRLLQSVPALVAVPVRMSTWIAKRDPDRFASLMAADSSAADRAVLSHPEIARAVRDEFVEAVRPGVRGIARETVLFGRPWGFDLGTIEGGIVLYQGERDVNVPPIMGRYLRDAIPRCRATFYPEEGHLSTLVNHTDEIVSTLIEE